jgi:hypothetical protein
MRLNTGFPGQKAAFDRLRAVRPCAIHLPCLAIYVGWVLYVGCARKEMEPAWTHIQLCITWPFIFECFTWTWCWSAGNKWSVWTNIAYMCWAYCTLTLSSVPNHTLEPNVVMERLTLYFVSGRLRVRFSASATGSSDWGFSCFFSVPPSQCRDSNLKLGHDRFLPNPFQFISIHLSYIHAV